MPKEKSQKAKNLEKKLIQKKTLKSKLESQNIGGKTFRASFKDGEALASWLACVLSDKTDDNKLAIADANTFLMEPTKNITEIQTLRSAIIASKENDFIEVITGLGLIVKASGGASKEEKLAMIEDISDQINDLENELSKIDKGYKDTVITKQSIDVSEKLSEIKKGLDLYKTAVHQNADKAPEAEKLSKYDKDLDKLENDAEAIKVDQKAAVEELKERLNSLETELSKYNETAGNPLYLNIPKEGDFLDANKVKDAEESLKTAEDRLESAMIAEDRLESAMIASNDGAVLDDESKQIALLKMYLKKSVDTPHPFAYVLDEKGVPKLKMAKPTKTPKAVARLLKNEQNVTNASFGMASFKGEGLLASDLDKGVIPVDAALVLNMDDKSRILPGMFKHLKKWLRSDSNPLRGILKKVQLMENGKEVVPDLAEITEMLQAVLVNWDGDNEKRGRIEEFVVKKLKEGKALDALSGIELLENLKAEGDNRTDEEKILAQRMKTLSALKTHWEALQKDAKEKLRSFNTKIADETVGAEKLVPEDKRIQLNTNYDTQVKSITDGFDRSTVNSLLNDLDECAVNKNGEKLAGLTKGIDSLMDTIESSNFYKVTNVTTPFGKEIPSLWKDITKKCEKIKRVIYTLENL